MSVEYKEKSRVIKTLGTLRSYTVFRLLQLLELRVLLVLGGLLLGGFFGNSIFFFSPTAVLMTPSGLGLLA